MSHAALAPATCAACGMRQRRRRRCGDLGDDEGWSCAAYGLNRRASLKSRANETPCHHTGMSYKVSWYFRTRCFQAALTLGNGPVAQRKVTDVSGVMRVREVCCFSVGIKCPLEKKSPMFDLSVLAAPANHRISQIQKETLRTKCLSSRWRSRYMYEPVDQGTQTVPELGVHLVSLATSSS